MADIKTELDSIRTRISDENFLANKGLSNEVGIHVFCYNPKHELIVRDFVERLTAEVSDTYRIIERDMYKIFLSIMEDEDLLADIPFLEKMKYEPHHI